MIKAIIFDYDGVIVDSFPVVHKVYQTMCTRLGKNCPPDLTGFKKVFGKSSREFMRNLQFTPAEIEKADQIYQEEILQQDTPFFPKIKMVVKELSKKYLLFLVSSSPHSDVVSKLKKISIIPCFTEIIAGKKPGPMKKVPELIALLRRQNLKPEEVVMIGDRVNDYVDAAKAGIKQVILVEYGWGYDSKEIPEPRQKIKVKTPKDIFKAVKVLE